MQQQRLFEITHLLVERGAVTANELAERFGVSRRTIYRDVDALSGAGIPVYAERGKGGGIRILPEYVLDRSLFSKDEQTQLVAHFQSLASLGTPDTDALLDKLAALFGRGENWLEVDFAPWGGGGQARALFRQLRDAILQRRVVHFLYTAAGGTETQRIAEPLKILFRGQGWYLYAFSRERGEVRYFKFTRIHALSVTDEVFAPRALPSPTADAPYRGPTTELLLRFTPEAAYRVYDEFPENCVEKEENGALLVRCTVPEGPWLAGYLLSFGADAEVVQPPAWREKMRRRLAAALGYYGAK